MRKLSVLSLLLVTTACTCPRSLEVDPVQNNDKKLSCREIVMEIHETEFYRKQSHENKGARVDYLLNPFCYSSGYLSAERGEKAAQERLDYLNNIYDLQNCSAQKIDEDPVGTGPQSKKEEPQQSKPANALANGQLPPPPPGYAYPILAYPVANAQPVMLPSANPEALNELAPASGAKKKSSKKQVSSKKKTVAKAPVVEAKTTTDNPELATTHSLFGERVKNAPAKFDEPLPFKVVPADTTASIAQEKSCMAYHGCVKPAEQSEAQADQAPAFHHTPIDIPSLPPQPEAR